MHPPQFSPEQKLSDWPNCWLQLHCCRGTVLKHVAALIAKRGDCTFKQLLRRLSCSKCGQKPAPVYLCASHHRTHCGGPPPDWAVEIVQPPKPPTGEQNSCDILPLPRAARQASS